MRFEKEKLFCLRSGYICVLLEGLRGLETWGLTSSSHWSELHNSDTYEAKMLHAENLTMHSSLWCMSHGANLTTAISFRVARFFVHNLAPDTPLSDVTAQLWRPLPADDNEHDADALQLVWRKDLSLRSRNRMHVVRLNTAFPVSEELCRSRRRFEPCCGETQRAHDSSKHNFTPPTQRF